MSAYADVALRRDTRFLSVALLVIAAIVFAGFAPTFYLKAWFGTPPLTWLVHLHGALMTSWLILFLGQVLLAGAGRVAWHRRLGIVGTALAAAIVMVATAVAIRWAARESMQPTSEGPPPLQFMGFLLYALLVYAVLVSSALVLRRTKAYHKRLMLLSCFALLGPGVFRLSFASMPMLDYLVKGGPGGVLGLDLLPMYACVAYDTWRNRRLHPAFLWGGLLLVSVDLPMVGWFLSSDAWDRVARWLIA